MTKPSQRTLLLGLGNDLLTDDAIGLRVAAAVSQGLPDRPDVVVQQSSEMGLALLDLVAGFEEVVIVDAVQTGHAPHGFVHELDGRDLRVLPLVSPHFLGIGEVLALGERLGLAMPRSVKILAVEVQDPFTVGTQMTPNLETALPAICQRVHEALGSVARSRDAD